MRRARGSVRTKLAGTALLTLALAAYPPNGAEAQLPGLEVGTLIRVRTGDGAIAVGTLERSGAASLGLRSPEGDEAIELPVASIEALWVHAGTRPLTRRGALIGLLAGGALGAVVGDFGEGSNPTDPGESAGLGMLFGAPLGFLIGAAIGAAARGDRWLLVSGPVGAAGRHAALATRGVVGAPAAGRGGGLSAGPRLSFDGRGVGVAATWRF